MPVWHQNRGIRGHYGPGFPVPGYRLFIIWSNRRAVLDKANPGSVVATSALVAAPVAAFIPPFLFGFAGPKTGIKRIVACYLVVSLFAAGFAFYVVMGGLSMVPSISSLTPVPKGAVFFTTLAMDLLLAAGVYTGMERAGVLGEGQRVRIFHRPGEYR